MASAQEKQPPPAPVTTYTVSYTPVYEFDSDLDSGGEFSVNRHFFRLGADRPIHQRIVAGVNFSFDLENWDFNTPGNGLPASPWSSLYRSSLTVPLQMRFQNRLMAGLSPVLESSGEPGSDFGKSLSYGLTAQIFYPFSPRLLLGAGFGYFDRIEDNSFFPFLIIRWQITDRLVLKNPFTAGPTGPAGLELAYGFSSGWELAAGGAYRSYRFRLEKDNMVSDGIGENTTIPIFVRLQKEISSALTINLYGGILTNGELAIEDSEGHKLQTVEYDNAPFAALSLSGKF